MSTLEESRSNHSHSVGVDTPSRHQNNVYEHLLQIKSTQPEARDVLFNTAVKVLRKLQLWLTAAAEPEGQGDWRADSSALFPAAQT